MLTPDQEKLKEAALAATPGPWMRLFGERTVYDRMEDGCRGNAIVRADQAYSQVDGNNLDYISLANPAAILAILAQLEQAQAALMMWWDGKCPAWMSHADHVASPEVNCLSSSEQAMGRAAAAIASGQPLPPPPEAA